MANPLLSPSMKARNIAALVGVMVLAAIVLGIILGRLSGQSVIAQNQGTPLPPAVESGPPNQVPAAPAPTAVESGSPSGDRDLIRSTLLKMVGKHATIHLMAGRELTGMVQKVTEDSLHLSELGGRDFFDAVVRLEHVSAVIYRVKKD
jgi:hypothetical protein